MTRDISNAAKEREDAQRALKNGELKDRETYTAKQVAYRCGTDAKTMRKFFRSKYSTVEPVGQGGRYEFDSGDMPLIKKEFADWLNRSSVKRPKAVPELEPEMIQSTAKKAAEEDPDFTMDQIADAIERAQEEDLIQRVKDIFGEDHEPTDEELEEMAKLEAEIERGEI